MKNLQKGSAVLFLISVIALLIIGGGIYIYENKKIETPLVSNTNTPSSNKTQQTDNQIPTTPSNIISAKPLIKSLLPTGLIPQNETVTIVGSGFAPTGNVVSIGYANFVPNYRTKNKEFILPSSTNGTKITFVPENYGIFGKTQAVGGGWLTVITTNGISNSVNLQVVKVSAAQNKTSH